jgi:MYXO-CTERM domain-containing protein
MEKCCAPLLAAALVATFAISHGQTLVDGSNYPGLFNPSDDVTVTRPPIPGGTLLISVTAAPEPSVFALGFLGVAFGRRRRR